MKAIKSFFATDTKSTALLLVRLALGVVILPHGMQKALGMFGGYGLEGTLGFFSSMGMPVLLGVLVILAEFVGPIGLILGLGTRFMAAAITIQMAGAMIIGGHIHNGFFMNWFGNQPGEGIEYFILVLGAGLALVLGGAGRWGLDNVVSKYLKK
ncbi:MAG TPA: DoxX family protein [Bacteroidales bacterium]|nr:DoxX family protein [Bacteroidales bacterium]